MQLLHNMNVAFGNFDRSAKLIFYAVPITPRPKEQQFYIDAIRHIFIIYVNCMYIYRYVVYIILNTSRTILRKFESCIYAPTKFRATRSDNQEQI